AEQWEVQVEQLSGAMTNLVFRATLRAAGQMAAGQMAAGQMAAGQMAAGQMAAGQMAAGQMAAGQMAAGQGPVPESTAQPVGQGPAGRSAGQGPAGGNSSSAWHPYPSPSPTSVIVRLVTGSQLLFDKGQELAVFKAAAAQGLGAKLLALFGNGRLEQWLTGYRPLTSPELALPATSAAIASALATFHACMGPATAPWSIPLPQHLAVPLALPDQTATPEAAHAPRQLPPCCCPADTDCQLMGRGRHPMQQQQQETKQQQQQTKQQQQQQQQQEQQQQRNVEGRPGLEDREVVSTSVWEGGEGLHGAYQGVRPHVAADRCQRPHPGQCHDVSGCVWCRMHAWAAWCRQLGSSCAGGRGGSEQLDGSCRGQDPAGGEAAGGVGGSRGGAVLPATCSSRVGDQLCMSWDWQEEVGWLQAILMSRFATRQVLGHNDVQPGNIMAEAGAAGREQLQEQQQGRQREGEQQEEQRQGRQGEEGERHGEEEEQQEEERQEGQQGLTPTESEANREPAVKLIDYDYSAWSDAAFDIANHWCEWAADYSAPDPSALDFSRFPTTAQRQHFISTYLLASRQPPPPCCLRPPSPASMEAPPPLPLPLPQHACSSRPPPAPLPGLLLPCGRIPTPDKPAQHWPTPQPWDSLCPAIDFNYAGYAAQRWQQYVQARGVLKAAVALGAAAGRGSQADVPQPSRG
ncbi:hypothetical protein QJQ45_022112, partial [Haematococcus lacustris]